MDASSLLWTRLAGATEALLPGIHGHQKKTLALFVLGIVSRGAVLSCNGWRKPAVECSLSEAKMSSIERRLARFIAN